MNGVIQGQNWSKKPKHDLMQAPPEKKEGLHGVMQAVRRTQKGCHGVRCLLPENKTTLQATMQPQALV